MAEPTQGVLDTSVVIDHELIDTSLLPDESAITAVRMAELAAGPHATDKKDERTAGFSPQRAPPGNPVARAAVPRALRRRLPAVSQ